MATKFEVINVDFDDLFEPVRAGFNSVEFDRKYLAPQNMTGPMKYMARTGDATNRNTDYYYYENGTWKLFDAHPKGYNIPKSLAISSGDWSGTQYTRTAPTHNMKFTVTWQDGTTEDVTSDVTISPSTWGDTTGADVYNTQTATFSYSHHGIAVRVTKSATVYRKLTGLTIGGRWSNNQYYKYAPTTAGLTATANFNTEQTADVAVKTTTDAWGSSDADYNTQTATFSYSENGQNVSATYRATVYKHLDRLEVSGNWSNYQYYNYAPTINGLTFTAYYNNSSFEEGVTPSVIPNTWTNTGEQTAYFSFTKYGINQTTSKTAIVYAALTSLEVSGSWSNTQWLGYAPDTTGLTFTANYNTGSSSTVSPSVSPSTWQNTGPQTATFSYSYYGKTASVDTSADVFVGIISNTFRADTNITSLSFT